MTTHQSIKIIHSQIKALLQGLSDQEYAQDLEVFNGSSIGKHVRHILDFYLCLRNCEDEKIIDYNCRERNPLIETHKAASLAAFQQIEEAFHTMSDHQIIEVKTDFSTNMSDDRPIVKSSVGRELMYAFDHAIHHLAILKMGVKTAFPHIALSKNLGVAPSTIKYHVKS